MLGNDRMETASTEVASIQRRNDIEKSMWKTHRHLVDFESRIHLEISTSNRCHNFHVDSPFKIDVISMNFRGGTLTSNRWRIDEDVSIGFVHWWVFVKVCFLNMPLFCLFVSELYVKTKIIIEKIEPKKGMSFWGQGMRKKLKIFGFQFFSKTLYQKQLISKFWKIALCTTRYQGMVLEAYYKDWQ